MSPSETDDLFSAAIETERLESILKQLGRLAITPLEPETRLYFDTFDGMLAAQGLALMMGDRDPSRRLALYPLDDPERQPIVATLPLAATSQVDFVTTLPPGELHDRLRALCAPRRLLPIIEVQCRPIALRLHNADDYPLLRILVERRRWQRRDTPDSGPLPIRLRIAAATGGEAVRADFLRQFADQGGAPATVGELREALEASAYQPARLPQKPQFRFRAADEAALAIRRMLLGFTDLMEATRDGARTARDPEYLHDFRVAIRRIRTLLLRIRGLPPDPMIAGFAERLAWLQRVTGPMRDLDVYVIHFDEYRATLPAELDPGLDALQALLLEQRREEETRLAALLGGAEATEFLAAWRQWLASPPPSAPAAPLREIANQSIWRAYRRIRRDGRALTAASPYQDFHALRKRIKNLRYLMESFHSLYPRADLQSCIRGAKQLLDSLGALQDFSVQIEHLRAFATRQQAQGSGNLEALLAIGALIGHVLASRAQARDAFTGQFHAVLDHDQHNVYRTLFKSAEVVRSPKA